jgi:hypothetical protein
MAGRDNYMYWSTGSRFQPFGLTHNPIMGNSMMAQHMMNSSMYKNIHSLKTEMPSDVLELFKANEVSPLTSLDRICETHQKEEVSFPRSRHFSEIQYCRYVSRLRGVCREA